jgi:SAM-dependent methyltransferase
MSASQDNPDTQRLRANWDRRYRGMDRVPSPATVLTDNLHLLPPRGRALDLACGLGAGALLLAERGLEVVAWDLSPVAIERLRSDSTGRGLRIVAEIRDVCRDPPEHEAFDVILVSHFLDRDLAPVLMDALRPGGLLFYQTFSREAVSDCGPSDPAFRLATNELLRLFSSLVVRFYREEGRTGDQGAGTRDIAQLVAQRAG